LNPFTIIVPFFQPAGSRNVSFGAPLILNTNLNIPGKAGDRQLFDQSDDFSRALKIGFKLHLGKILLKMRLVERKVRHFPILELSAVNFNRR